MSPSGPVSEVSGGSDSSSEDQVVACDLVKGQTGQLHGRRRLPPPHVASPWQQQRHRDDVKDHQGQRQWQREERDDGVLRNFPEQTGRHLLMTGRDFRERRSSGTKTCSPRLRDGVSRPEPDWLNSADSAQSHHSDGQNYTCVTSRS